MVWNFERTNRNFKAFDVTIFAFDKNVNILIKK